MNEPPMSEDLAAKKCKPCEGGTPALSEKEIKAQLSKVPGWAYLKGEIVKVYTFKNFRHTMAFVNAVANIADEEDHHPEMEVGYKTCKVRYSTHAIKGISENDFICAAKIEQLLK